MSMGRQSMDELPKLAFLVQLNALSYKPSGMETSRKKFIKIVLFSANKKGIFCR